MEGKGRPLITAIESFRQCLNSTLWKKGDNGGGSSEAQKDPHPYMFVQTGFLAFLVELLFNQPWENVIPFVGCELQNSMAKDLFKEILKVCEEPIGILDKKKNLHPALINKWKSLEVWADLFRAISSASLKQPKVASCFSSSEIEIIEKLLKNPKDSAWHEAFSSNIIIAHRDRNFAKALFSAKQPKSLVRVVPCGYSHIPGVIQELERLSAAQKKSTGKTDQKKSNP